jgi:hypothetical protein
MNGALRRLYVLDEAGVKLGSVLLNLDAIARRNPCASLMSGGARANAVL